MSDDAAAAQPFWDDAWAAWVVRDPERPDAWLLWSDASSSWQPLPVAQEPVPFEDPVVPIEDEPEPLPAPVAARFHANGPLRPDAPIDEVAPVAEDDPAPGPRRSTYEAPIADRGAGHDDAQQQQAQRVPAAQPAPAPFHPPQPVQHAAPARGPVVRPVPQVGVPVAAARVHPGAQPGSAPIPAVAPPHAGPFVDPSAAQLIAVPAPRSAGGGTAVLALGIASVGIGALVMLIGVAASSLLSLGVGDPGAVRVAVNLLAVLAFPIAALGVVLGALQLRGGPARHRDRALIGLGVCGTVTLVLVARAVTALANTVLHGYPLL